MKVLIVTGCIFAENCGRTSFTGLDYVVGEIAETVGTVHQVDVFTITPYPESSKIQNGRIRSYTYGKLLKYISRDSICKMARVLAASGFSIKSKIKAMRAILVAKEIERLCKQEKYGIIHVHGLSFSSFLIVEIGLKTGIPVLYTLHGLLGYGAPDIPKLEVVLERRLLNILKNDNHILTCVSSGVKNIICNDIGINPDRVIVINNAVNLPKANTENKSITQLSETGKKIIISVGTISERKNQIQIVRAYNKSPDWIKQGHILVLAGKDTTNGEVERYIKANKLENDVILMGFLPKEDLAYLYDLADYNVMLSLSEGFGLSMIEAASYGIPTLAYADLDAIQEIYDENSMCLVSDHDDNAVIEGFVNLIQRKWDHDKIRKSAERFSKEVYMKYLDIYNDLKKQGDSNLFVDSDQDWKWLKYDN